LSRCFSEKLVRLPKLLFIGPTFVSRSATAALVAAVGAASAWRKLLESDVPALNQQLKQAGFPEIKTESEQVKL
jgi:hypothetical protein